MEISGLGPVEHDEQLGWFRSAPVPVLDDAPCRIAVEGYDGGPDFHAAIRGSARPPAPSATWAPSTS
ncbi:hypothetical protein KZ829_08675 [Actinoplanes hulinensis]|uniref:Uncharacterized protein n=1 Tax=Actinoplanes hulinensis TaxID=1144547 RepID=A0ABS7B073_9ACTN|nr:hypothetical protein [Actinoplanes hulinensis]MBW6433809.1 hypothetical protein [Actinoplanes hulinensis]